MTDRSILPLAELAAPIHERLDGTNTRYALVIWDDGGEASFDRMTVTHPSGVSTKAVAAALRTAAAALERPSSPSREGAR